MITIPHLSTAKIRWISLLLGAGIFIWSRLEENAVQTVIVLAFITVTLGFGMWIAHGQGGRIIHKRGAFLGFSLFGALIGLSTSVGSALLMLLKNGSHGHLIPDYPTGLLFAMLNRAPLWALCGALIGVGIFSMWVTIRPPEIQTSDESL